MASQGPVLVPRNVHVMELSGGRRNRPVNVGLTGRTNSTYWAAPPKDTKGNAVTTRIMLPPTHVRKQGERTVLPPPSRSRREPSRERARLVSRDHPRRPKPPSPLETNQQDGGNVNQDNQSPPPTRGTQQDGYRLNEIYELWKTDSYRDEARQDGRKKLTPLATTSRVLDPTGLTEESMEWLQGYTEEEERRQAVMKKCADWVNSLPSKFPVFSSSKPEREAEPISALPPIIERE